jgi:four helix bundle protein
MNYNYIFAFEKLSTWKESRELAKKVYFIIEHFPKYEHLELNSEIRRAA